MDKPLESKEKEKGRIILEKDLVRRYKKAAFCSAKSKHDLGGAAEDWNVHGMDAAPVSL